MGYISKKERLRLAGWDFVSSLASLFDGLVGVLCLGFYRPTTAGYVAFWRALGVRPQKNVAYTIENNKFLADGEEPEAKCMFFTGKKK